MKNLSTLVPVKGPSGITVAARVTNTGMQGCGPFTFTLGLNYSHPFYSGYHGESGFPVHKILGL
ncbi:MAG: hypothetical protein ACE5OR_06245 [bacterium]